MTKGYNIPNLTEIYGLSIYLEKRFPNIPYVIENVKPWYNPLIPPSVKLGRHYFWSNSRIPGKVFQKLRIDYLTFNQMAIEYGLNVKRIRPLGKLDRRKIIRNCVQPEIGKYIFDFMKRPVRRIRKKNVQ
jgi:DNA (cytosine-5)-methyltransferase 1